MSPAPVIQHRTGETLPGIPRLLLLFGPAELDYGRAEDSVQTLNLAIWLLGSSSQFLDSVNSDLGTTGSRRERFISDLESTRSSVEALCLKPESTGFRSEI